MNVAVAVYSAILFFLLSPNILLRLPKNGSKFTVAAVHAVVFGVIVYFTQRYVLRFLGRSEGFEGSDVAPELNEKKKEASMPDQE